jgi:hypothetical protein
MIFIRIQPRYKRGFFIYSLEYQNKNINLTK